MDKIFGWSSQGLCLCLSRQSAVYLSMDNAVTLKSKSPSSSVVSSRLIQDRYGMSSSDSSPRVVLHVLSSCLRRYTGILQRDHEEPQKKPLEYSYSYCDPHNSLGTYCWVWVLLILTIALHSFRRRDKYIYVPNFGTGSATSHLPCFIPVERIENEAT